MDFRAFEATPGISVILLPDAPLYTHVAVSNDFVQTSGMKREQVIGSGHFSLFPKSPDDPNFTGEQNLKASFDYILQHKVPHEIPFQRYDIPNGDGTFSHKYWKIKNAPLFNEYGEVAYIIHSALDITDQVMAEQKVDAGKGIEKAYNFFMNAPMIIGYLRGEDYVIELANEGLLEVWGRTAEVVGLPLFEAIPELEEQGFKPLLDKVRLSGEPFHALEFPITLNRQGKEEVRYFDFVYKPYYEEGILDTAAGVIGVGHDVTEQVLLRQKFKNVVQQAADPILILKGEDMLLEVANEALFQLWKVDEKAIGKTFLEILPEMKGQGFLELLQQVYHTGKPFQGYETPAVFDEADGTTRTVYFNFTYQPYREADGKITGVLVLATDVTGQVLAKRQLEEGQEEVRKSKERFDLVNRATQDAVWDWNLLTDEVIWNENVQTLFGYTSNEVIGHADWWYQHVHPEDRDRTVGTIHKVIDEGGSSWTRVYRFACADGSYKIVFDRGFIQHDDSGKCIRMIGSMQDITERKQYEWSLKESQQKWQQLANSIPALVWTALPDGQINFLNAKWYDFTGLSETQSVDFGWTQALHPDDVEPCLAVWNNAREKEIFYEIELRYKNKEGQYRWFVAKGVPIKNEEGQVTAWYGTSTDIHEQKMLSENLERLVAERTTELQRSNNSLEQFAHAASHDMKEPLRKIRTFTDRLKRSLYDQVPEGEKSLMDRIEISAERMQQLVDDLLEFAHVSEQPYLLEAVDLNETIQEELVNLELLIEEKQACVKVDLLPTIKGNKRQLQQLFHNLLNNALKYSKPDLPPEVWIKAGLVKGATMPIALAENQSSKTFYLITITDNGIGFEKEYAEQIFEMFKRLHGKTEYAGTGVGLSLVKKVTQNHKGYIWAESEPGVGSTFKVLLPTE